MHIFVSHISEESPIAICIKEWIETTLLGQCKVFVSSDASNVPVGVKWLTTIDNALTSANVMLVICSESSMTRPWVNFETGCAWALRIPILPLCHSGINKSNLPRPLSEFQGLDFSDQGFPRSLFEALKTHLSLPKIPRIAESEMQRELARAISEVPSRSISNSETAPPPIPTLEPRDEGNKILHFLGHKTERGSTSRIAGHFRWGTQQTQFFIDELVAMDLLKTNLSIGAGVSYSLNEKGRKYLFEHGML